MTMPSWLPREFKLNQQLMDEENKIAWLENLRKWKYPNPMETLWRTREFIRGQLEKVEPLVNFRSFMEEPKEFPEWAGLPPMSPTQMVIEGANIGMMAGGGGIVPKGKIPKMPKGKGDISVGEAMYRGAKGEPLEKPNLVPEVKPITAKSVGGEPPKVPPKQTAIAAEPPIEPNLKVTVDKFNALAKSIRPKIYETEALRKPVRAAQRQVMEQIAEERQGFETIQRMSAQRAGELPKAGFEPIADKFTPAEAKQLHNVAIDAFRKGIVSVDDAVNASQALDLYMMGAQMPRKFELDLFREIFGNQFAESIKQSSLTEKAWRLFIDVAGLLRANKASADFSGLLRQGAFNFARHPLDLPKNIVIQARSMFDARYAKEFDMALRQHPTYLRAIDEGNYYFANFGKQGALARREENFMTRLADRLPWVRISERSYVNGLNKMRLDRATRDFALLDNLEAQGIKITDADRKGLGTLTNALTGRGDLPKTLKNLNPLLNNLLFSPRYVISRFQLPAMLMSKSPIVRKEAAKDIAAFLAWGAGTLGIASLAGAKVELDTLSSDFGKIIIGNTRVDVWTGYAQYIRFLRQMQAGERKTITGKNAGQITPANRMESLLRMVQSKLSPGYSLFVNLMAGELYGGQKIEATPESMRALGIDTLVPMVLGDIYDAARIDDLGAGAWAGALSGVGVGISTYEDKLSQIKGKIPSQGKIKLNPKALDRIRKQLK